MGVDTMGIMNVGVTVRDIVNVLVYKFGVYDVNVEDTHDENFKVVIFEYKTEQRRMAVFTNYNDLTNFDFLNNNVEKVTLIDLNLWGSSVELISGIVEEFGGYVTEADIGGVWEKVG